MFSHTNQTIDFRVTAWKNYSVSNEIRWKIYVKKLICRKVAGHLSNDNNLLESQISSCIFYGIHSKI